MNAEHLLTLYERVADGPYAISRLRRFVLDLAVRGKIVEQDPADEPAAELLRRIAAHQKCLLSAGRIKLTKVDPIASGEFPFNIPNNWRWTRLGNIGDWGAGSTPLRSNAEFFGGNTTWLKSGELNDNRHLCGSEETVTQLALDRCSFRMNRPGDVLIAMYGATIGKLAILTESAVTNQAVCGCTPFPGVLSGFLFLFLLSQRSTFQKSSEGGAQPNISKVKIVATPFPLPPLAEQHRIVEKVDELIALCDQLGEMRTAREQIRNRLTKATLTRISTPVTNVALFRAHAHFAIDALPALTARADQISDLRQTILNLAVRGKLVKQNPEDEPASELLKRIATAMNLIIKERKIRRRNILPALNMLPFPIPENWCWVRIREIASERGQKIPDKPFTYIDVSAIDKENGLVSLPKVLEPNKAPSRARKVAHRGDVIYSCVRPYLLNVAIIEDDFNPPPIVSTAFEILDGHGLVLPQYIWIVLRSPFIIGCVEEKQRGQAYPAIKSTDFALLPFPLPPFAEQHRIAAKVDELMALCNQLEVSIASTNSICTRLLEMILYGTLASSANESV